MELAKEYGQVVVPSENEDLDLTHWLVYPGRRGRDPVHRHARDIHDAYQGEERRRPVTPDIRPIFYVNEEAIQR